MLAAPVGRGVVEGGRRPCSLGIRAAERPVVADIGPDPPRRRLALGQDRHRGVVAMQPPGGQDMRLDERMQRLQREGARTHLVSQRRDAQLDPLAPVALALRFSG